MDVGPAKSVNTTCPYCGVGCGVKVMAFPNGTIDVAGDKSHPANFGRLCSKGSALGETVGLSGRLLHPYINGKKSSWAEAARRIAKTFLQTIEDFGPEAVAFYVSGQLLTEDYYVANKLMKGFIGSANIDTNSRLCMASAVAGHKRAFGADTVPGCYEDLEHADLLVLVGSNLAWCHPVLHQRVMAEKKRRPAFRIVVIDPRRSATTESADLFLQIKPGTDVALFNALFHWLARTGHIHRDFVDGHTTGIETALLEARKLSLPDTATATGLSCDELETFFRLFAQNEKTVTAFSQGINQAVDGTNRVNTIINCHLLTGRIGRPGMGPFSITGQPNAMGGREVGGLANQLAAHMELDNSRDREYVQNFWQSPTIARKPGLKAVDLFEAVADGKIKALWIMATNPVDSMPNADLAREALKTCPFVVVSDVVAKSDTLSYADIVLPAAAWGEKSGTVTNSERRISRQRSFRNPPGQAKPDWQIICDVATEMGWGYFFNYKFVHEIFREHATLSDLGNKGTRDFDIGALSNLSRDDYDGLAPTFWPYPKNKTVRRRLFADGLFFTPDRRARFIPTPAHHPSEEAKTGSNADTVSYPLILNTGRIRDQWHTMTRTGGSPRLSQHYAEPFVEINADEATALGIADATLVQLTSPYGRAIARALLRHRQQKGTLFAPMHWTDQFSANARMNALIAPTADPVSGQPALKSSNVHVAPFPVAWCGFSVLPAMPAEIEADYWAVAPTTTGIRLELAHTVRSRDWISVLKKLLSRSSLHPAIEYLTYEDKKRGTFHGVALKDGKFLGGLYVSRDPVVAARSWLIAQQNTPCLDPRKRQMLLAGLPGADAEDPGHTICSCMNVGANRIKWAIQKHGCTDVDAIGKLTGAGTNCGSCRSELQQMLDTFRIPQVA